MSDNQNDHCEHGTPWRNRCSKCDGPTAHSVSIKDGSKVIERSDSEPIRVIVVVSGGVVQDVFADAEIDLSILDWDNAEGGAVARREAERLNRERKALKVVKW